VACQGLAILMISSELPELLNLARRIIVMREGFLTGELSHEQFLAGSPAPFDGVGKSSSFYTQNSEVAL